MDQLPFNRLEHDGQGSSLRPSVGDEEEKIRVLVQMARDRGEHRDGYLATNNRNFKDLAIRKINESLQEEERLLSLVRPSEKKTILLADVNKCKKWLKKL